jgi:hypothetical protein
MSRSALSANRCFPSHSPTLRPWIGRDAAASARISRPAWRGSGARRSCSPRKSQGKAADIRSALFPARGRRGPFSLGRGLIVRLTLVQAGHHLVARVGWGQKRRGRPVGSPSLELLCGQFPGE